MSEPSVIHDIGYQRYAGERLGRPYAVRSLYEHSIRTAYGLGRGVKAKIFPWSIVGIMLMVAAIIAAIQSQIGERVVTYVTFVDSVQTVSMIFVAIVAPELVSRDLRAGVLPLYFSRPLRRSDYALTKYAALASVVFLLFAVPLIVIFAGAAFGADGIKPVWHEFQDLVPGLAYAAICAVVHAAVALLAASFSKRRAFAAAGVVAAFLVTLPVVGAIRGIYSGDGRHLAMALNPLSLTNAVGTWLFEPARDQIGGYGWVFGVAAVALTGWCIALLLARYRRVAS